MDDKWFEEEGYVQSGEIRLHYVAAGPVEGEPVLLLHGFPQSSYLWRRHLPALAKQGYRVVAPDLRGYNLSDRPSAPRSLPHAQPCKRYKRCLHPFRLGDRLTWWRTTGVAR